MVERKAKIDGDYRYWLYRKWDGKDKWLANSNRKCLFICINPNTADNNDDDQTTETCMNFAKNFGCGVLYMVNLYAMIGIPPKDVIGKPNSIEGKGKDNDGYIMKYAEMCSDKDDYIVVAWGNDGRDNNRARDVKDKLCDRGYKLYCIRKNKPKRKNETREPRHPSYLTKAEKDMSKPIPYPC